MSALGIAGAGDQAGAGEHLDVFRDGLFRDGERGGQLVDGGIAVSQVGT